MNQDFINPYIDDIARAWVEVSEIYDRTSKLKELEKRDRWAHDLAHAQLNQANKKLTSACVMTSMAAYRHVVVEILDRLSESLGSVDFFTLAFS